MLRVVPYNFTIDALAVAMLTIKSGIVVKLKESNGLTLTPVISFIAAIERVKVVLVAIFWLKPRVRTFSFQVLVILLSLTPETDIALAIAVLSSSLTVKPGVTVKPGLQ